MFLPALPCLRRLKQAMVVFLPAGFRSLKRPLAKLDPDEKLTISVIYPCFPWFSFDALGLFYESRLGTLGEYLRRHAFVAPLYQHVQIRQKTIKYRPVEKLLDALVGILCGAKTIAQSNVTVRGDAALQRAFGRKGGADQSTIARTLQAGPPQ